MLISIIVPVYNVEEYLVECIESVLSQSYTELEIVLVDDGSTDNSGAICDEWAERDARIKVFHISNSGVSRARNFGVEQAHGEYIMFADSDDVLLSHAVERGVSLAKMYHADIVYGMVHRTADVHSKSEVWDHKPMVLLTQEEVQHFACHLFDNHETIFKHEWGYLGRGPYSRLLRREFALLYSFNVDIVLGEDETWNLQLLTEYPRCVVDFCCWYIYRINMVSASMKFRPNRKEEEIRGRLISLMPLAGKFHAEPYLFNKSWEVLASICERYYFHAEAGFSLMDVVRDYQTMSKTYPWKEICLYKWARPLGIKGIIKWGLMKTNLVIPFRYLKDRFLSK